MDIVNDIVWHSFLFLLWIGSVLAILLGAGLLLAPMHVEKVNRFFGRWIDTRTIETEFDRPRLTERYIYRHHRIFGTVFFAGAVTTLYCFLLSPTRDRAAMLLSPDTFGLFDAGMAFLIIGNVLAAVIGAIVFFRPSLLREFEDVANQWISTDRVVRFFNKPQRSFDNYVLRHRRAIGIGLIVAGLYISFFLGNLLLFGQWRL
jgi:hypothetical protein